MSLNSIIQILECSKYLNRLEECLQTFGALSTIFVYRKELR